MSKKERRFSQYLTQPPSHTPQQLQNSIDALREFNPSDKRIARYEKMKPKAQEKIGEWQEKESRVKAVLRGKPKKN